MTPRRCIGRGRPADRTSGPPGERRRDRQDISLDVRRGELFGIVGPSGSGKSSLLRLLNRLDEPTSGTVFLEGQDYRQIPPRELAPAHRHGYAASVSVSRRHRLQSALWSGATWRDIARRGNCAPAGARRAARIRRAEVSHPLRRRAAAGFAGARAGQPAGSAAARRTHLGAGRGCEARHSRN